MKRIGNKLIIAASTIIVITLLFILMRSSPPSNVEKSKIEMFKIIEYPSDYNFKQSINACGPFNTAAVVRALTNNKVSSAAFSDNIGWRYQNGYTLPWGVENQLKDNGIQIEIPNIKTLSDEDKIAFLRERLSQGKPVIILGERDNEEHYITLFGFSTGEDEFYLYDSLLEEGEMGLTKDENGDLPGNRNYSSSELLNFWRGGGMYGGFEWYAIVCSKSL